MARRGGLALAIGAAIAAIALCAAAATVFAPTPTGERVFAGRYAPDSALTVRNLTVADGLYRVSYSLRIFLEPPLDGHALAVTCSIVDTGGRIEFFDELDRDLAAGSWVTLEAAGYFELPELTLGLRCAPQRATELVVLVRDARIEVTPYRPD